MHYIIVDLASHFVFGRGEESTMQAPPTPNLGKISKQHFEITKSEEDDLIYIKDLSKNGTYINGIRLGKGNRKILKHQDQIAVTFEANVVFMFLCQFDDFLPQQLLSKYATLRKLGHGSCGDVRLVKDRDSFKEYAVKKITLSENNSSQIHLINHPAKINNEISILKKISHPCIVQMIDIINIDREVFLVLEYMAGGELSKRIMEKPMSEFTAKFYFLQILLATQYLHSQGIIHRDLKAENILLRDNQEETLVKITDFGLSKVTNENAAATMCGTLRYVAPEVIYNVFRIDGEYGKQVDVWSLGVILYYMISREFPFNGDDAVTIKRNIAQGNYKFTKGVWARPNKACVKDLLEKMFQTKPTNRISISKIVQHNWIKADHCVKYRVKRLLNKETLIDEPSPKKYKFDIGQIQNSSDNKSSNPISESQNDISCSPTICCA
ncbi:hypothetical protein ABEB36_008424 [Hypothenemus hampei]|uniref:Uncharacterized protein n=1 Tax=Hypothenemus hampei TaxID=57062 RepID=A0ABD1EMD6_HYPHA